MSSVIASSVAEHHPGPQTQEQVKEPFLRPHIHYMVASSHSGCLLPCCWLANLCAPYSIGGWRDDLCGAAFCDRHPRREDLAGMADCHEELDRVVGELIARRSGINRLFLVGSCPSEVIKLDLETAAAKLQVKHENRVRISAFSGSGIETTFTQGEDQCLKSTIAELPVLEASKENLIVLGTVSDIVEDQFRRLFDELDIKDVHFYPGVRPVIYRRWGKARAL